MTILLINPHNDLSLVWEKPIGLIPTQAPSPESPPRLPCRPSRRIPPQRKAQWCCALRSGVFHQIYNQYMDNTNGRCALGVLYSLVTAELPCNYYGGAGTFDAMQWLELGQDAFNVLCSRVINMNDEHRATFAEIADYIEANW
jgi:hypothetical protein